MKQNTIATGALKAKTTNHAHTPGSTLDSHFFQIILRKALMDYQWVKIIYHSIKEAVEV